MKPTSHVVFGGGKLACGFIVPLLINQGRLLIVTRTADSAHQLQQAGGYDLVSEGAQSLTRRISGYSALPIDHRQAVINAVATASAVWLAAGQGAWAEIAAVLAQAAADPAALPDPLPVVIADNMLDSAYRVAAQYARAGNGAAPRRELCFCGARADRIIGERGLHPDGTAFFHADDYPDLWVERDTQCMLPPVAGIRGVSAFGAAMADKLFVFNCAHATVAYVGWLTGYDLMAGAVQDSRVRAIARAAAQEARAALAALYGSLPTPPVASVDEYLGRMARPALPDRISRVARDPLRKLGADDRLLGPALRALALGVTPRALGTAVAAALLYRSPAEPQCQLLDGLVHARGLWGALCSLAGDIPIAFRACLEQGFTELAGLASPERLSTGE